ncbi:MAG: DNA polymerase Y family protein [Terracidiphilus sp.]
MTNRSNSVYAAIHAAEFPAQAILRLRPDLQSKPVVVLDGIAPQERVCSLNLHARKRGVVSGMTRLEVEELTGVCVLSRSVETELAARAVLLESVSKFSPRIEETHASNACGFVLDISGTERLFGPPATLAQSLRNAMLSAGFRASVSVSHNFHTARINAEFTRGITVIPSGREAAALAAMTIAALRLEEQHYETFALWGIGTLGELAELPEEDLISRLGQQTKQWLKLSRGTAEHPFQPIEARFELKEHIEFETHVEQLDSLLFIAASMINNLVSRATGRALSLATLTVQMSLEKSLTYERVIRPAIPSNDRKFLLKLLQLEIAAHPPQAAIASLTLRAEAGQQSKVQLGLFAPQTPEPSRLDVTLARLRALVGDDRVGSPVLKDTHRSGSFAMEHFAIPNQSNLRRDPTSRLSLRRMRPPHPLRVQIHFAKPASFRDGADRYDVQVAYGPWHSSGCWWSINKWDMDEWDVIAMNNLGETIRCLIAHDNLNNQWLLDALYD